MLIRLTLFLHESSCFTSVLFFAASHALSHFILCFSDKLIPWRKGDQSAFTVVKTTLMMYTENKPKCIGCDLVHMYPQTNTSTGRGHVEIKGEGPAEPGFRWLFKIRAVSQEKWLFASPWHLYDCTWSEESSFSLHSTRHEHAGESSIGSPNWSAAWTT